MESLDAVLDGSKKASGLKNYLVLIEIPMPYPKEFEFRQEASSIAPAVSRSLKELRKKVGRKKIVEFKIKARQL